MGFTSKPRELIASDNALAELHHTSSKRPDPQTGKGRSLGIHDQSRGHQRKPQPEYTGFVSSNPVLRRLTFMADIDKPSGKVKLLSW